MAKYKRTPSFEELDEEVKEVKEEVDKEIEEKKVTQPEETWEKRYGDLRRHSDQKIRDLETRLNQMAGDLEKEKKRQAEPPVDPEEFKAWIERHSTASRMVKAMIQEEVSKLGDNYKNEFQTLKQEQQNVKLGQAKVLVARKRPDFFKDIATEEFGDFLKQTPWANSAINTPDLSQDVEFVVEQAISAYDYFIFTRDAKASQEKQKEKEFDPREAATSINTKSGRPSPEGKKNYKFSESAVQKMSVQEYESKEKAITEAIQNGEFLYDLS